MQTPPPPPSPARATILKSNNSRPLILGIIAVAIVALLVFQCSHRENGNETEVRRITEAIQKNDMGPVAKDFNAITRAKLTRSSVGRLSDEVAPLGKIKRVEQVAGAETAGSLMRFIVHFDKADWHATMGRDMDKAVDAFHLSAAPPNSGR